MNQPRPDPLTIDHAAVLRRPAPTQSAALGADPAPALVVLHGYGASERDLVDLLPYLGHPGEAYFLRAPLALSPSGEAAPPTPGQAAWGWAWFPLVLQPGVLTARPEDIAAGTDALITWLTEHLAGREVILLGFSQGGAMAVEVLRAAPPDLRGRLRALVLLSGFVAGDRGDQDAVLDGAPRVPVFFGHGGADVVIPRPLSAASSAWLAKHTGLTEREYPGLPHAVDAAELSDVRAFLNHALESDPPQ